MSDDVKPASEPQPPPAAASAAKEGAEGGHDEAARPRRPIRIGSKLQSSGVIRAKPQPLLQPGGPHEPRSAEPAPSPAANPTTGESAGEPPAAPPAPPAGTPPSAGKKSRTKE